MCPKDLVCDRKTWYVIERPGTFLKDLTWSRKLCLFSKTVACDRKRCHLHSYCVRNIWHVLENQIRKKWMVLLVVISVSDNNCIPESTNKQQSASHLGLIHVLPKENRNVWAGNVLITYKYVGQLARHHVGSTVVPTYCARFIYWFTCRYYSIITLSTCNNIYILIVNQSINISVQS